MGGIISRADSEITEITDTKLTAEQFVGLTLVGDNGQGDSGIGLFATKWKNSARIKVSFKAMLSGRRFYNCGTQKQKNRIEAALLGSNLLYVMHKMSGKKGFVYYTIKLTGSQSNDLQKLWESTYGRGCK